MAGVQALPKSTRGGLDSPGRDPSIQRRFHEISRVIVTHTLPLADAARGYAIFEKKQEDCRKVVLATG